MLLDVQFSYQSSADNRAAFNTTSSRLVHESSLSSIYVTDSNVIACHIRRHVCSTTAFDRLVYMNFQRPVTPDDAAHIELKDWWSGRRKCGRSRLLLYVERE